jgi:putative transposase
MKGMSLTKSYHCIYDTHYHVVFPVKYRKALLDVNVGKAIREIAVEIEARYEIAFEELGADNDHIHILCSFHPKISGGDFVRIFKSLTARELFKRFPELRKELWGGEFWSDGYYVATVSNRGNWKVVEQYIKNQGKTTDQVQLRIF